MNHDPFEYGVIRTGKMIHALVGDMVTAMHIAKVGSRLHVGARNFDKAATLFENAIKEKPFLIILDFEKCEAEAFQVLNKMRGNADFKSIPMVGFVTHEKGMVKPEAERAGCSRVYLKTEFGRELPDLIARYAV